MEIVTIAKELQNAINKVGQACVIHFEEDKVDVLFGYGWSDMDDETFEKINNIIEEYRKKYPEKVEEGAAADITSPYTKGWVDHIGEVFYTKDFDVPDYYKMQYLFTNHINKIYG